MQWSAQAPANIALIKYMGKKDELSNLPDNSSLSYTLSNLVSTVQLTQIPDKDDRWEPLSLPGQKPLVLAASGQQRFLNHLARLKSLYNHTGSFLVQSANNFPQGSGLASSASSFAALTRCALLALSDLKQQTIPPADEQAQLSRLGSGSSCRSFYAPWVLWQEDKVTAVDLPYPSLVHQVIVVSAEEKTISSSEAHRRVRTSPFYHGRPERATERLNRLLNAFKSKDWFSIYSICWEEFHDMHHLFSSCAIPFNYITPQSTQLLHHLEELWKTHHDGPIVTMDAGPNIHLLYREDQLDLADQFARTHLDGTYHVL